MSSPDWWQDQLERDLAEAEWDGDPGVYEKIAAGTSERWSDRMAEYGDKLRDRLDDERMLS